MVPWKVSRGWDWVKRQDLLTGGGRWWSWRIFSAVSLLPDINGTASGSLLDSVLSTLLNNNNKKTIQECLESSSCSLITDYTVALDWSLNGCYNLRVLFYVWVLCLKTNSASSNKENPLAILESWISSALQLLLLPLVPLCPFSVPPIPSGLY